MQAEFALRNCLPSIGKQSVESVSLSFRNQRLQGNSNNLRWWPADQLCESAIAVEHDTFSGKSRCALAHRLYQHAIVGFEPLQ